MDKKSYDTIEQYINDFPKETQDILNKIKAIIEEQAPEAESAISYQMPTYKLNGNLIHYAAYKNHIGIYPTPSATAAFDKEIKSYKHAKGSIQLPLNQPIPYDLIRKIVAFRVIENKKSKAN